MSRDPVEQPCLVEAVHETLGSLEAALADVCEHLLVGADARRGVEAVAVGHVLTRLGLQQPEPQRDDGVQKLPY